MRLFIAISFDNEVKDFLHESASKLREMSESGNFTRRDNFHLTLHFIGETSRVSALKNVMNAVSFKPFVLKLSGNGVFKRDGGDIHWIGIDRNDALNAVYRDLKNELTKNGFKTENRPFKPHLTLGREVVLNDEFAVSKLVLSDFPTVSVDSIHLMKSERINGKLTYTSIYKRSAAET